MDLAISFCPMSTQQLINCAGLAGLLSLHCMVDAGACVSCLGPCCFFHIFVVQPDQVVIRDCCPSHDL
jgi:hypothetical protein